MENKSKTFYFKTSKEATDFVVDIAMSYVSMPKIIQIKRPKKKEGIYKVIITKM